MVLCDTKQIHFVLQSPWSGGKNYMRHGSMELERAISDLEEVRDRLPRFNVSKGIPRRRPLPADCRDRGRLRPAARSSVSQSRHALPSVRRDLDDLSCRRLALNYGAVAIWVCRIAAPGRERVSLGGAIDRAQRRARRHSHGALITAARTRSSRRVVCALFDRSLCLARRNPGVDAMPVTLGFALSPRSF